MKYAFIGLLAGILFGFLPLFEPVGGFESHPEWHGYTDSPGNIETSGNPYLAGTVVPPLQTLASIIILGSNGAILKKYENPNRLSTVSGSGMYIVEYEKVGKNVEFLNMNGERFWKMHSMEYPYLSYNSRVILLLNGDHSSLRVVDYNGNETSAGSIKGRLCNVISMSDRSDYSAAGFIDGNYYLIDEKGALRASGIVPEKNIVKSIGVSGNGMFFAVHYGGTKEDSVRLQNIEKNRFYEMKIRGVHPSKTALYVTDSGRLCFLDYDRIILADSDCDIDFELTIPAKRDGHSRIAYYDGIYVASFGIAGGGAQFVVFREDGTVLISQKLPEESFLDSFISGHVIYLRGSKNLYCYSYLDSAIR
jgi:hypothetical protein